MLITDLSERKPLFELGDLPFVRVRREGEVAVVSVDRPEKGNALNPMTLISLRRTVDWILGDPNIAGIVLTGTEPGFVQGAEIDFMIQGIRENRFDRLHRYTDLGNDCFDAIAQASKPIVAVVNGPAVGGGFELALACSARFAVPGTSFSLPETGLGICPLWGAIPRLIRLVGKGLAKWLVYSGKPLKASEALELGLLQEVLPSQQAWEAAVRSAKGGAVDTAKNAAVSSEWAKVADLFGSQEVRQLFHGSLPPREEKQLFTSLRRVQQNSFLALQHAERMFEFENSPSPQRTAYYREVVESLYRSEDTILGLEWRKTGKIAPPPFPSNR